MKFNVLICARGGSKGLKNKNIKSFSGKPLISWSISLAKKLKEVENVYVSTDSKKIANISMKYGAEVPFLRPKNLASNNSSEWDAWRHALNFFSKNNIHTDGLIILPATSPLRRLSDINKCINAFKKKKCTIICITDSYRNPHYNMVTQKKFCKLFNYKKKYHTRQEVPKVYDVTTVCFILKPSTIFKSNYLYDDKVFGVKVPKKISVDIDDIIDFKFAEYLKNINV
tara:strand:- start:312 stop:992 length:681 start_codon:yes stop_codon:yes gene_type:complete